MNKPQNSLADLYRVFIIRCWNEADPHHPSRYLLEIPRTGERYGFVTAEQLIGALRPQLNLPPLGVPHEPTAHQEE
ncbi:MAG: hypothetical protein KA314_02275 [Chloroflexi bacterium]|nr:hypothetical protein [Chloroflexota bacterium]MBP8054635.1 hypothetical protein [Chloroflexota bacterium]